MTALAKGPLTAAEKEFLAQCEETIDAGLMTFVEVGQALMSIRENRLYRAQFPTFEEYCAQRWQISRPRAYELMTAATVVSGMPDTVPPPTNARQAVELARVPEPQRAEVWQKALEATDGKPTAAAVREAARPAPGPTDSPTGRSVDVATPIATPTPTVGRSGETAEPAPAVADGAGSPPAPSAPSPLEAYLAGDVKLQRTGWQKNFAGALAKSIGIVSFTPEQVAEYADRDLVDELRRLVANLDDYATRAEKAWNQRHGGLRVLRGGVA